MGGLETSANLKTRSNGPWRSSSRPPCSPTRCPPVFADWPNQPQRCLDTTPSAPLPELGEGFDLEAGGEAFYRHYMTLALERAGGVQVKAAEMLGMSFRSFRYYAKKFNLR